MRCQCKTGVLFDHPCRDPATTRCSACGRGTCAVHIRATAAGQRCVPCLRQALRDRQARGHFAFLRDDPYFYWYFSGSNEDSAYDEYDYQLFDERGGHDDAGHEPWEGS